MYFLVFLETTKLTNEVILFTGYIQVKKNNMISDDDNLYWKERKKHWKN